LDNIYIGSNVKKLSATPKEAVYTGVIINTSDNTYVSAGDISSANAHVLEVSADWATTADAQRVLQRLNGFTYRPYTADGVIIDPTFELGDNITIDNLYSGIYGRELSFSSLMASNLTAPQEDSIDNEYKFQSSEKREYSRKFAEVNATLLIQADAISAKLENTNTSTSFGWELTDSAFILKASNSQVFKCDSSGIEITGKITATSGFIGTESNGFVITASAIYNGMTSFSDTSNNGVYIGTNGIALGKGAFKVDSAGNLTATSGTFSGNVYAGSIQSGGTYGTFDGSGITSGTIGTGQTSSYINSGIANGYYSSDVFNGAATARYCYATTMKSSSLYWAGYPVARRSQTFHDGDTIAYLYVY